MILSTVSDVAVAVRRYRGLRGLSQAELAARAGVSRKWVSEVENGKASVELALLLRVFAALGVSLSTGAMVPASGALDLDAVLADLARS